MLLPFAYSCGSVAFATDDSPALFQAESYSAGDRFCDKLLDFSVDNPIFVDNLVNLFDDSLR